MMSLVVTNPTKKYHHTMQFSQSDTKGFSIFQVIVLVLWPETLLFWFTLMALIKLISSQSRQLFSAKSSKPDFFLRCEKVNYCYFNAALHLAHA